MTGVKPKQSLGQNFLIDENIARNIIRDLQLTQDDVVVEIGPGNGALTKHLGGNVRALLAVEIDKRVIEGLRQTVAPSGTTILHKDFLELDLAELMRNYGRKLRIVGNIPYHLTSPILFKIFDEREAVEDLTIMVQREVARRIAADPGSKVYGILSVMSRFYGMPRQLFDVSPNCFYPKPRVTSTVIQFKLMDRLPWRVDEAVFRTVVRTAFGKRRKTLRNSLKYLPYSGEVLSRLLGASVISLDRRPEQLSIEEFVELSMTVGQFLE